MAGAGLQVTPMEVSRFSKIFLSCVIFPIYFQILSCSTLLQFARVSILLQAPVLQARMVSKGPLVAALKQVEINLAYFWNIFFRFHPEIFQICSGFPEDYHQYYQRSKFIPLNSDTVYAKNAYCVRVLPHWNLVSALLCYVIIILRT